MTLCPVCAESIENGTDVCSHCASPLFSYRARVRILTLILGFCLLAGAGFKFYLAMRPGSLGVTLIRRLLWVCLWSSLGLYLLLAGWLRGRKKLARGLWLTALVLIGVGAVYGRCWNELRYYRTRSQPLLEHLTTVQQKAKQPCKLDSDLDSLQSEWDQFSKEQGQLCSHLTSYQKTEQAIQGLLKGQAAYREGLLNRGTELATDFSAMKKSTQFGPEASAIYKVELKKAQKLAAAKVVAAQKKLKVALAAAEAGKRKVQQAEQLVNSARHRVDRSYANSSKAMFGEGNVFSAEFNSNRDPSSAYDYLSKCEEFLSQANEAAEQFDQAAESAREELDEVEKSSSSEALEKADQARQRVQNQIDRLRFSEKQKEINKRYSEWFQTKESMRLSALAGSESVAQDARNSLALESPWQILRLGH